MWNWLKKLIGLSFLLGALYLFFVYPVVGSVDANTSLQLNVIYGFFALFLILQSELLDIRQFLS